MSEVLGPIIGITLVLMSVFLPSAFMSGITGQLYQQFALTIAATAFISAINAVTLKPAQCALWLRPHSGRKNFFTRWFDKVYGWLEAVYAAIVRGVVKVSLVMMLLFAGLMVLTVWWYQRVPTGFIPTEDQGYGFVLVQLPDAASQDRTKAIMRRIDDILAKTEGIQDWVTIGGLSILDNSSAPNTGTLFVTFSPFEERLKKGLSLDVLLGKLRTRVGLDQRCRRLPVCAAGDSRPGRSRRFRNDGAGPRRPRPHDSRPGRHRNHGRCPHANPGSVHSTPRSAPACRSCTST